MKREHKLVIASEMASLEGVSDNLDDLCEELSERFTRTTERWQKSRVGLATRERIELIESARDKIEEMLDLLSKARGQ